MLGAQSLAASGPGRWRCRQSKNFPRAIPSQPTTRVTGDSVRLLNSRTKSTTASRVSGATQAPVRAPQAFFEPHVLLGDLRDDRALAGQLGFQLLLPTRRPMTGKHRWRRLEE